MRSPHLYVAQLPSSVDVCVRRRQLAERADHHPDILISYRKVTLTLSTHSASGLTEKDFSLAAQINAIA